MRKFGVLNGAAKQFFLMGGICGVSRGTFFQGIKIVALTTVRATI